MVGAAIWALADSLQRLNKLLPLVKQGGLIIAHNMNARQADVRFVNAITEDKNLETLILLKEGTGVGVTLKKRRVQKTKSGPVCRCVARTVADIRTEHVAPSVAGDRTLAGGGKKE